MCFVSGFSEKICLNLWADCDGVWVRGGGEGGWMEKLGWVEKEDGKVYSCNSI